MSAPRWRERSPMFVNRSPPFRTAMVAFVLFFFGTCFLGSGIGVYIYSDVNGRVDKGMTLIFLGLLMFIPGSYATTVIYGTMRGWRGYDYSELPSYDD